MTAQEAAGRVMRSQRGIATGWLIGILALVLVVVAAYFYGRHDGAKINEAAWQEREAKINADAAIKIKAADDKVRDAEHRHAEAQNDISTFYEGKLKEKNNALNTALNSLHAGTGKLFVNATCPAPAGDATSRLATGTGERDGAARTQLSDSNSEFLLRIGAEADAVVLQLTACQGVIRSDRNK